MTRTLLSGAAAVIVAALVPTVPATAQQSASEAITVRAPVKREREPSAQGVNPRMQLVSQVAVDVSDLDLRTGYGRAVLDARVRLAADEACDLLDAIDPPAGVGASMNPDGGDCRHLAAKNAHADVRRAIWAAG